MPPDDVFIREQGSDGICAAYNRILQVARSTPACEGVVLIHDDTRLGALAREQVLRGLRDSGVGLVGVVGGRDLHGPIWVDARHWAGVADDTYGRREYGPATAYRRGGRAAARHCTGRIQSAGLRPGDVSGLPRLRHRLLPAGARANLRVRVVPVDYRHVDKGDLGDQAAFDQGFSDLRAKWPHRIQPLGAVERLPLRFDQGLAKHAGRWRHEVMTRVMRQLSRRKA